MTEIRDLGVQLDSELILDKHIEKISKKAYSMLGFVLRQGKAFKKESTLRVLYNSLVLSHLQYASTVWNPGYSRYVNMIERVQNKYHKHMKFRFKNYNRDLVPSLEKKREVRDQIFLYKIMNNLVDSIYLVGKINLKCSRVGLRNKNITFATDFCRTNYSRNRFIVRSTHNYNNKYNTVDIFQHSCSKFINSIVKHD